MGNFPERMIRVVLHDTSQNHHFCAATLLQIDHNHLALMTNENNNYVVTNFE